jgi:hypothetical protein
MQQAHCIAPGSRSRAKSLNSIALLMARAESSLRCQGGQLAFGNPLIGEGVPHGRNVGSSLHSVLIETEVGARFWIPPGTLMSLLNLLSADPSSLR